ncbi:hypothetical protein [Delftia sp. WSY_14]|uniref:hypothetical protein n=1 Tax=unclassified Delftia TaxID=2613839 RepID=UPI00370B7D1D
MNNPIKNDNLKNSLSNKLYGGLRNCAKAGGRLHLWSNDLKPFYEEASKKLVEWIDQDDLVEIIYSQTSQLLGSDDVFKNENQELHLIIGEQVCRDIAALVIEKIASLPIRYFFDFPAPNLVGLSNVFDLCDSVRLIPREKLNAENIGSFTRLRQSSISIGACGYAKNSQHNTAARNALSKLKVVCVIGRIFGLFMSRPGSNPMTFEMAGLKTKSIFATKIVESEGDFAHVGEFDLGLSISSYMNNLSFSFDPEWSGFSEKIREIGLAIELMDNPKAEKNVRSIRRALEWLFDAETDEDVTTRFIKICIGLEAVLGEQSKDLGITEQLADRCAFILNKTTEDRKNTREAMKEIYKLRSQIVHGVSSRLTHKEAGIVAKAKLYLDRVLRSEISSLLDWWRDKQEQEKRDAKIMKGPDSGLPETV